MTSSVVVPSKAACYRTQLPGPVINLMCLVSQLWSESIVIDVALRQWFLRCAILARFDNSFIMLSSVVIPRGARQSQILSSAGFNFFL